MSKRSVREASESQSQLVGRLDRRVSDRAESEGNLGAFSEGRNFLSRL